MEGETPCFRRVDVDMFGLPHYYGVENYFVISTEDDISPHVTDWVMEKERRGALRPPHRYSRVSRFRALLYDLMGHRNIPDEILECLNEYGFEKGDDEIYESIREVFKVFGYRKYYNSIPSLIMRLRGQPLANLFDWKIIEMVNNDFQRMSNRFDNQYEGSRLYFPNLRYVALNLLELNGVQFGFRMKKIRTPRKVGVMENIFDLLY
jgi:hypothetical protein